MSISKKKVATSATAVGLAAMLLLGGTFAWQSISQTALNEASDVINPGGRLHDDFNGENKDVYVENFAEDDIFARIRLDEYFEIVQKTGTTTKVHTIAGSKDDEGNIDTWSTHYFDSDNATDEYWNWSIGGQKVFMPTFNKNKDSLEADINGTYYGPDNTITDLETDDRYTDYQSWELGDVEDGSEIYDADTNGDDEVGNDFENLTDYVDAEYIVTEDATHEAQETLNATLMSMQTWMDEYNSEPGEYWVYDTDGWVYWAQPIQKGEATGLLLDGISLDNVMDDSWYYAINVIAQFITADDLGYEDSTGFYADGESVTDEALALLEAIGVDTGNAEPPVSDKIVYRIYNIYNDEGVNYCEGEVATLESGEYTLFVSSGEGGVYRGQTPEDFVWSVDPELNYSVGELTDNSSGGIYVSVDFTLDDTVPYGSYTFTATNATDEFTMVATIEWNGDPEEEVYTISNISSNIDFTHDTNVSLDKITVFDYKPDDENQYNVTFDLHDHYGEPVDMDFYEWDGDYNDDAMSMSNDGNGSYTLSAGSYGSEAFNIYDYVIHSLSSNGASLRVYEYKARTYTFMTAVEIDGVVYYVFSNNSETAEDLGEETYKRTIYFITDQTESGGGRFTNTAEYIYPNGDTSVDYIIEAINTAVNG